MGTSCSSSYGEGMPQGRPPRPDDSHTECWGHRARHGSAIGRHNQDTPTNNPKRVNDLNRARTALRHRRGPPSANPPHAERPSPDRKSAPHLYCTVFMQQYALAPNWPIAMPPKALPACLTSIRKGSDSDEAHHWRLIVSKTSKWHQSVCTENCLEQCEGKTRPTFAPDRPETLLQWLVTKSWESACQWSSHKKSPLTRAFFILTVNAGH